jgi:hypothetical protein
MILIFAQKGNTEHLVQCFSGGKVLGFFTVRLTALALVLGNFGRIDSVYSNTQSAIREGSLLERRGSSTDPVVGRNVPDSNSVAVNNALCKGINAFLFGKESLWDVVDRLKLYYHLYCVWENLNIGEIKIEMGIA